MGRGACLAVSYPDRWASDREGPTAERARVVAGNDNLMAAGGS